jgi:hypothetical protein
MIDLPEAAEKISLDPASFHAVVFADPERSRRGSRNVRLFACAVVVLAHFGLWWLLRWSSQPDLPGNSNDEALLIDFITRAPVIVAKPPELRPRNTATQPGARPSNSTLSRTAAVASGPKVAKKTNAPTRVDLFNDDGSVHVPDDVLANLAKLRSDDRQFDFQIPGLRQADALLVHRKPLEYTATRFDKDWRPNQDLLTDVLTRAVEATTKEVKIPIPGDPRHHVICRISLLAMGGGCGVARNGEDGDVLPGHDDPNTLSAEEDRACQAWWERIISAKTQDEWRQTRHLYDQECRKPLAQQDPMPETIKAPSGP